MIVFRKSDLQIIAQHSRDLFPTESCGIILGKKQDNIKIVTKIFPTKNILKSRTKYQINPREQLNIYMKADEISLKVLGYYHSHPFGDTKPSEIDIKEAVTIGRELHDLIFSTLGNRTLVEFMENLRFDVERGCDFPSQKADNVLLFLD